MTFFIRAVFFTLVLGLYIVAISPQALAGNTVSVNYNDPMPDLAWTIANTASPCQPTTTYLPVGSNIEARWTISNKSANGTETFRVPPPAGAKMTVTPNLGTDPFRSYTFTCRLTTDPTVFDTSTLVVCNNTTHEKDGAGGCRIKGAPSGNFSFVTTPPCSIALYSSSCTANTSWTTSNVSSVSVRNNGTPFSTATSSSGTPVTYAYGNNTLTIVNTTNGQTVHSTSVNISCENPGADWNGTSCVPGDPKVENQSHSLVTQNSVRLAANITSDGGVPLTARGFCWGLANNPTSCTPAGGTAVGNYLQNVNGLNPGTTYYYRGYATNQANRTGYSFNGTFLTRPATPNSVRLATPTVCGTGQLALAWDPVPSATSYTLYDFGVQIYSGANTNFTHTGLVAGSPHRYTVLATNASGASPQSTAFDVNAPADCVWPDLQAQTPSFNPAVVEYGDVITFTAVIRNTGGAPAGQYEIGSFYIDHTGDGNADFQIPFPGLFGPINNGDSQTVTANWTVPDNAVISGAYRVGYFADVTNTVYEGPGDDAFSNWSGWSSFFEVRLPLPKRPGDVPPNPAPVDFTAQPGTCGGRLNISWGEALYATGYEYRIKRTSDTTWSAWRSAGGASARNLTISGLVANTSYDVQLAGVNSTGRGTGSDIVSANGLSSNPCYTLNVDNCQIPTGDNNCSAPISWNIEGYTLPTSINNITTSVVVPGSIDKATSSVGQTVVLRRGTNFGNANDGQNVFEARYGSPANAINPQASGFALCDPNTDFFHHQSNSCINNPSISLSAQPASRWVRNGDTARIITTVTANFGVTCSFGGNPQIVPPGTFSHSASPNPVNYTSDTVSLNAATDFRVICNPTGQGSPTFERTIRINVIPTVEER